MIFLKSHLRSEPNFAILLLILTNSGMTISTLVRFLIYYSHTGSKEMFISTSPEMPLTLPLSEYCQILYAYG